MRTIAIGMFAALSLALGGCGGGGGDASAGTGAAVASAASTASGTASTTSSGVSSSTSSSGDTAASGASSTSSGTAASGATSSSGTATSSGSASGTSTVSTSTSVANTQAISVSLNQYGYLNVPMTSVTICVPGTNTCQTIDNVIVDTGSYGLRLMASAVTLTLPQPTATTGGMLANCAAFGSGTTWGSVRTADIKLAGEVASGASIQLIADSAYPTTPTSCSDQGVQELSTPASIGANGILGVGLQAADCPSCVSTAQAVYYGCTSSACTETTAPLAQQVTNPVAQFPQDNNGVIVQLPSVPVLGSASASGTLIFGIGTQANNGLGSANIYTVNASTNSITTQFGGTTYSWSFIDSGSNGLFFDDASIPTCASTSSFYCPTSTVSRSAVVTGLNGVGSTVNFSISNALQMVLAGAWAMPTLGADVTDLFDWGLPFFFGKTVYTAIAGASTPGGTGPYYAF